MAIKKQIAFEGTTYNLDNKDRVAAAAAQRSPDSNGIQRITTSEAFTINDTSTLVDLAVDPATSLVVTMPSADAGRHLRVFWSVEQETDDWVFTCAGSDTFAGNIQHMLATAGDSTAQNVAVANTTVAITTNHDVNIGSYIDFRASADGTWLTNGHLVILALGNISEVA